MRLKAVARQVLHGLAGPAYAALGVQVELVALVGQDEFAGRLQASVSARLASGAQAARYPVGEISI